jgi:hypothetical protein
MRWQRPVWAGVSLFVVGLAGVLMMLRGADKDNYALKTAGLLMFVFASYNAVKWVRAR